MSFSNRLILQILFWFVCFWVYPCKFSNTNFSDQCDLLSCFPLDFFFQQEIGILISVSSFLSCSTFSPNSLRGRGHKGLRSLLCCHFFQKSSNILIFWYCGRNVCFFKIPQFQDPTQTPSWLTPSAYSYLKLHLTYEIMDSKLSEKMKIFHIREFGLQFELPL